MSPPTTPPPGRLISALALNLQLVALKNRGAHLEDLHPTTRDAITALLNRTNAPEKGAA